LRAGPLHALGAQSLAAKDATAARAAAARGDAARAAFRAALPPTLRTGYEAATQPATIAMEARR
jgi:hypothetical protein